MNATRENDPYNYRNRPYIPMEQVGVWLMALTIPFAIVSFVVVQIIN
jgi:hypothetical protein